MNNFNFNRDFYEGCRALGDREGMALAWAMLRYGYEGVEPKLKPTTMAAFTFARGRIDAMVNGSLGGLRRAANAGSQGGSQGGSQASTQGSSRQGCQQKEKEKEITLAGYSAARQAHDDFEPPSAEDVEAYFAANCLRGDARQFFDHYAAQGWTLPSGLPVTDVWALARNWSRKQVGFDADLKARGGQTSQEVDRAALWKPAETEDDVIAALERELGESA
nr:MAG TPA: hypothetical protein [Caudoviricetes sp.]